MNQLKHIRLCVLPAANLDLLCYLPVALLESSCVAGVRPEHPRLARLFSGAIAVLDGRLRLPVFVSGTSTDLRVHPLTPRRPGPPALLAMLVQSIVRVSDRAAWRDRQSLGRDGTARSTMAVVESRDVLRRSSVISAALGEAEASTCRQEHGSGSRCGQSCFPPALPNPYSIGIRWKNGTRWKKQEKSY